MQSQIQRPYIDYYNAHLRRLADENWDDLHVLSLILAELLYRRKRHAVVLRQRVVARIIELQLESFAWASTDPQGLEKRAVRCGVGSSTVRYSELRPIIDYRTRKDYIQRNP